MGRINLLALGTLAAACAVAALVAGRIGAQDTTPPAPEKPDSTKSGSTEPAPTATGPVVAPAEPQPEAGNTAPTMAVRPVADVAAALDALIEEKWKEKKLTASPPADDGQWLRRAYLDTVGRAPSLAETQAFLASTDKNKRTALVDTLLTDEEHAEFWAELWAAKLAGGVERQRGAAHLEAWLKQSIHQNVPFDVMVKRLLTADGEVGGYDRENRGEPTPAAYFVPFDNDANNIAGNISRVFLGIQIQCAQCHDHPYEHWKQADFKAFTAFFKATRVSRTKDTKGFVVTDNPVARVDAKRAERQKDRVKKQPKAMERLELMQTEPKFLGSKEAVEAPTGARLRTELADWVASPKNPWFARTAANRLLGHYLKRGIVDPVDDFSSLNEPSNPAVLQLLTDDFAANNFDLKRLARIILTSKTYALSGERSANNADDRLWYSRAYVSQLSATQVLNSLISSTGAAEASDRAGRKSLKQVRKQLTRQFSTIFEDDEGKEKESFTGTIPQALLMMNGEFVGNAAAANPGSTLYIVLKEHKTPQARIEKLYLAAFCRNPTEGETARMAKYLADEGGTVAAYEDVFWALLNSAEFLNNH